MAFTRAQQAQRKRPREESGSPGEGPSTRRPAPTAAPPGRDKVAESARRHNQADAAALLAKVLKAAAGPQVPAPDGAMDYPIPDTHDTLRVRYGEHGAIQDVDIQPGRREGIDPNHRYWSPSKPRANVLDHLRTYVDRRYMEVRLRDPLRTNKPGRVCAIQVAPDEAWLVDPDKRGTPLHRLRPVGDGLYMPDDQVGPANVKPDYTHWQTSSLSVRKTETLHLETPPHLSLIRVKIRDPDAGVDSMEVVAWEDAEGRKMLPALGTPEGKEAARWLEADADGHYRAVAAKPTPPAPHVIDPDDTRWKVTEWGRQQGNLRSAYQHCFAKVKLADTDKEVFGSPSGPYGIALVDPRTPAKVVHRLRHVGDEVYKPATQVRPGQERPDYRVWEQSSGPVPNEWRAAQTRGKAVAEVAFRDPAAPTASRAPLHVWALETGGGRAALLDPNTYEELVKLKKNNAGVYEPVPWEDALAELREVAFVDQARPKAYASGVNGYADEKALLADVRRRGRFYREMAQPDGTVTRVYRIPGAGVGLQVGFDAQGVARFVDEPPPEDDAVFKRRIRSDEALGALDDYARKHGYAHAAALWKQLTAKGVHAPTGDGRTLHRLSDKNPDKNIAVLEWPQDPDGGRLTRIELLEPDADGPVVRRTDDVFAVVTPSGTTVHSHNRPSLEAPLHLIRQPGERCSLPILNMLNWVLMAGGDAAGNRPTLGQLCDRLAGEADIKKVIDSEAFLADSLGQVLELGDMQYFNQSRIESGLAVPALQWTSAQLDTAAAPDAFTFEGWRQEHAPADLEGLPAVGLLYRGLADSSNDLEDRSVLIVRDERGFRVYDPQHREPLDLNAETMRQAIGTYAATHCAADGSDDADPGRRQFELLYPGR